MMFCPVTKLPPQSKQDPSCPNLNELALPSSPINLPTLFFFLSNISITLQFSVPEDEFEEGYDPNIRARVELPGSIHGPTGEQVHDFREQISAKHDFVVQKKGVYRFCFTNKSPYHETIDFDVQLGHFAYYDQHAKDEHFTPLMEQISKLEEALYNIQFEQHWLEAQTDRQAIVNENMSKRAVHKALFESFALIGASVLQVYLLRRLFERKLGIFIGNKKGSCNSCVSSTKETMMSREHPPEPLDFFIWTVQDVGSWLEEINLGSYRQIFKENSVNGEYLESMSVFTTEQILHFIRRHHMKWGDFITLCKELRRIKVACLKGEQRVRRPWWAPSCLSVVFVKAAKRNRHSRVVSLKLES
ncbi:hypothetical protein N665_0367s0023 [Sinapis alba]|nr:hypothetical protein N665_0367s0023 [Sinapis alba]